MVRLNCEVEVGYQLAVTNGGAQGRSSRSRAAVSLGKKAVPVASGSRGEGNPREELYFIVSTAKNMAGTKYKVRARL